MPSPSGWMEVCFYHPVVCCSPSLPYYSHLPLSPCCVCTCIGLSLVRRWRQPAIYASKQVCTGWHRTGACYTEKLTFFRGSSIKVGVRIIQICVLYSNFYMSASVIRWLLSEVFLYFVTIASHTGPRTLLLLSCDHSQA